MYVCDLRPQPTSFANHVVQWKRVWCNFGTAHVIWHMHTVFTVVSRACMCQNSSSASGACILYAFSSSPRIHHIQTRVRWRELPLCTSAVIIFAGGKTKTFHSTQIHNFSSTFSHLQEFLRLLTLICSERDVTRQSNLIYINFLWIFRCFSLRSQTGRWLTRTFFPSSPWLS